MRKREILFRGRRIDNGEWVEGSLLLTRYGAYIVDYSETADGKTHDVDPATVGQFTGLKDKNGKRIFEGDCKRENGRIKQVKYNNSCACFGWAFNTGATCSFSDDDEVIGNIHEEAGQ